MAHNISYNSQLGIYEVMTRGAAWHNLGQVVKDCQTWQATMQKANLGWTISKRQLEINGDLVPAWGVFRDDMIQADAGRAFLCSTTQGRELIQNQYMFAFLDTMIESDGAAMYEAAGALNGGTQVFALINLGQAFDIGISGDRYESYLTFLEDRTGQRSAKCFITTVRVVCANTFEMAYSQAKDAQSVRFRHDGTAARKMADAAGLFTGARMDTSMLQAKLEHLATKEMTKASFMEILDELFPTQDEEKADTAHRRSRFKELIAIFDKNDNDQFPEIRGTAYNLLNATTEYVDHYAPVKTTNSRLGKTDIEIRSERAMFGKGAEFKSQALDLILEKTANNPTRPMRRMVFDTALRTQTIELEPFAASASVLDAVLDKAVLDKAASARLN